MQLFLSSQRLPASVILVKTRCKKGDGVAVFLMFLFNIVREFASIEYVALQFNVSSQATILNIYRVNLYWLGQDKGTKEMCCFLDNTIDWCSMWRSPHTQQGTHIGFESSQRVQTLLGAWADWCYSLWSFLCFLWECNLCAQDVQTEVITKLVITENTSKILTQASSSTCILSRSQSMSL